MHERLGMRGDQLDDDSVRGAVVAEDLDLGEQHGAEVAVDELRGLLDGGERVLLGAEEVLEEDVVGAEEAREAVAEDAVRVGEDDAADLGVGETDVAAEEVELGHEGDFGAVSEHGGDGGDDAGEVGAREADAAEEGEDVVRLLGGAQADARGRRGNGGLREAAGVSEEVEHEGAGVSHAAASDAREGDGAAPEEFEEIREWGRATRAQGLGGAAAAKEG